MAFIRNRREESLNRAKPENPYGILARRIPQKARRHALRKGVYKLPFKFMKTTCPKRQPGNDLSENGKPDRGKPDGKLGKAERLMLKPATKEYVRSLRGLMKLKPGEKPATQELLEDRAENRKREEKMMEGCREN